MPNITREELLLDEFPQAQVAYMQIADPSKRQGSMEFFADMAGEFTDAAVDSLDNVIDGEPDAKLLAALSAMMTARQAMSFSTFGKPGVGKSEFDKSIPYLIKGVTEEQIARVYPRSSQSDAELVGKVVPMEKTLTGPDGEVSVESYVASVLSLINSETDFIVIDDAQRVNQKALEATLNIVQDGTITVYDENRQPRIQTIRGVKLNYNGYGYRFSMPFPEHFAHRIGNGVEMGRGAKPGHVSDVSIGIIEDEDDERQYQQQQQRRGSLEVVSVDNADMLANIVRFVKVSDAAKKMLALAGAEITHTLLSNDVNLGDPRTTRQLKRTAKTRALSDRRTVVEPNDVMQAFEFGATAKYGGTGVGEVGSGLDRPDSIERLVFDGAHRIAASYRAA